MITKLYQKHKEKLWTELCERYQRYQNVSEEEKEKKRQYGCERYKNPLKDEFRKNVSKMQQKKTSWV